MYTEVDRKDTMISDEYQHYMANLEKKKDKEKASSEEEDDVSVSEDDVSLSEFEEEYEIATKEVQLKTEDADALEANNEKKDELCIGMEFLHFIPIVYPNTQYKYFIYFGYYLIL
ncbi:hypothetical protein HID58_092077 [Brassica napus]|uniref:Uncharacterized protein n=1 Tax=Brassica napus TaxID=3708 RepID=A0ABQ7WXN9_BRANA|nr:hypothetical protein HID58_092077 [Brassica napus]